MDINIPDTQEVQSKLNLKLFLENSKDTKSHTFILNIVNYADNVTQGENYPYRR